MKASGEDAAGRAEPLAEHDRHRATARTDIGDGHPGLELQHLREPRHGALRLGALLSDLPGILGMEGADGDDCDHSERELDLPDHSH